jgi:hypothetical protein
MMFWSAPQSIGECGGSGLQDQRRLDFVKRAVSNRGQLGKPRPAATFSGRNFLPHQ